MNHERVYYGRRPLGSVPEVHRRDPLRDLHLSPRTDVWDYDADRFEWGNGGSGAHQLALALLCDALADEPMACTLHGVLVWDWIQRLPHEGWEITENELKRWAMAHDRELADLDLIRREEEEGQTAIDAGDVMDLQTKEVRP